MDAEALLDTRAKDLQALTFRLSPPARPRRVIGWVIDEHLRTDLVESALSMAVAIRDELAEAVYPGRRPRLSVHIRARLSRPLCPQPAAE
jgi:hypothetical protein